MTFTSLLEQPLTQSHQPTASERDRVNPWQRTLAVIVLLPIIVGLGLYVAAFTKHREALTALALTSFGTSALLIGGSLALIWILVGAITWQIREAARRR